MNIDNSNKVSLIEGFMKYLFICKSGIDRSPTAMDVMDELAQKNRLDIEASRRALDSITFYSDEFLRGYFELFDVVFVMEKSMGERVLRTGYGDDRVVCLNIEDNYYRGQAHLVHTLEGLLTDYLKKKGLIKPD